MIIPKVEVSFHPKRNPIKRVFLTSSSEVNEFCRSIWDQHTISLYEEFYVIFLDRRNGVIGWRKIGQGNCAGVIVNVQLIFAIATQCNTTGLILCHNHPSNHLSPSQQDRNITNKIRDGCQLFDMKLLDHLIISEQGYYSFLDEGEI